MYSCMNEVLGKKPAPQPAITIDNRPLAVAHTLLGKEVKWNRSITYKKSATYDIVGIFGGCKITLYSLAGSSKQHSKPMQIKLWSG